MEYHFGVCMSIGALVPLVHTNRPRSTDVQDELCGYMNSSKKWKPVFDNISTSIRTDDFKSLPMYIQTEFKEKKTSTKRVNLDEYEDNNNPKKQKKDTAVKVPRPTRSNS